MSETSGKDCADAILREAHFSYLDSLRGLAALGVVMVHSAINSHQKGLFFIIGSSGQRGVQLFYIISAFTLYHSLETRRNREQKPIVNYFIRRFFRIAPLFYLAMFGLHLLNGLVPRSNTLAALTPLQVFLGIIFLNGFDPNTINRVVMGGWSVAVETTFYLILPVMFSFMRTFRSALLLLILVCLLAPEASYAGYRFFHHPEWSEYFYFLWFPIEFPIFCMGIATYLFWRQRLRDHPSLRNRRALSLFFLLSGVLIFLLCTPVSDANLYASSAAFLPLILSLSLHEWKFLVNPITIFLGRISYSVYLGQFFCAIAMDRLLQQMQKAEGFPCDGTVEAFLLNFFGNLALTIPLATLTYLVIEKPGIHLGRILIERHERLPMSERL